MLKQLWGLAGAMLNAHIIYLCNLEVLVKLISPGRCTEREKRSHTRHVVFCSYRAGDPGKCSNCKPTCNFCVRRIKTVVERLIWVRSCPSGALYVISAQAGRVQVGFNDILMFAWRSKLTWLCKTETGEFVVELQTGGSRHGCYWTCHL